MSDVWLYLIFCWKCEDSSIIHSIINCVKCVECALDLPLTFCSFSFISPPLAAHLFSLPHSWNRLVRYGLSFNTAFRTLNAMYYVLGGSCIRAAQCVCAISNIISNNCNAVCEDIDFFVFTLTHYLRRLDFNWINIVRDGRVCASDFCMHRSWAARRSPFQYIAINMLRTRFRLCVCACGRCWSG